MVKNSAIVFLKSEIGIHSEIYCFFCRLQQELKHQLFVVKTLVSTVSNNHTMADFFYETLQKNCSPMAICAAGCILQEKLPSLDT